MYRLTILILVALATWTQAQAQIRSGQADTARVGQDGDGRADSLYRLAMASQSQHDLEGALGHIKKAIGYDPGKADYWGLLVSLQRDLGNARGTIDGLEELIRIQPDEKQHYIDQVYIYFYLKEYDTALKGLDRIATRFGKDDFIATSRAQIHLTRGQLDAAIWELESAIQNAPESSAPFVMLSDARIRGNRADQAMLVLDRGLERFPDDPRLQIAKSELLARNGKGKEAFQWMEKAFVNPGLDADAKADLIYDMTQYPAYSEAQVRQMADRYVAAYPDQAKAHGVRGDIYSGYNRAQEARNSFMRAIEIDRNIPILWQQAIQLSLSLGQTSEARELGQQATALFPQDVFIQFLTGNAYLMAGNHQQARAHLETALNNADQQNPQQLSQLYGVLGGVYHALGMYAESDVAYTEALETDSLNILALNNYAYYLSVRQTGLDRAAEMSRRTLLLEPDNATYEDTYAWILFRQGRYEEALTWIRRAIANNTEPSATLLDHYGDILYKNGKVKEALAQWKKARKTGGLNGEETALLIRKINEKKLVE